MIEYFFDPFYLEVIIPSQIKRFEPKVQFFDDGVSIYAGESKTQKDGTCKTCGAPREYVGKCNYCQS